MKHCAPAVLAILLAAGFVSPVLAVQAHQRGAGPCTDKSGIESRTLFDYRKGIDLAYYSIVPGSQVEDKLGDLKDGQRQQEARERAYVAAFDLVNKLGLSYKRAMPLYLDGYRKLRTGGDQSILAEDIKIYREREIDNWDNCNYTYIVELAVPRFPGLGAQLDPLLKALLAKSLHQPAGPRGEFQVNVERLLADLLDDPRFVAAVKRALADERFRESIRYKDDDTQIFIDTAARKIQIAGYPVGQYRVNSIVAAVIQQTVLPIVTFYLEHYGEVVVDCEGFTDQLKIIGSITYTGSEKLASSGSVNTYTPSTQPEPQTVDTIIRNNGQLSVARAHEGIAALAAALDRFSANSALTLRYSGLGVAASVAGDQPASRKIIFHISYSRARL